MNGSERKTRMRFNCSRIHSASSVSSMAIFAGLYAPLTAATGFILAVALRWRC